MSTYIIINTQSPTIGTCIQPNCGPREDRLLVKVSPPVTNKEALGETSWSSGQVGCTGDYMVEFLPRHVFFFSKWDRFLEGKYTQPSTPPEEVRVESSYDK